MSETQKPTHECIIHTRPCTRWCGAQQCYLMPPELVSPERLAEIRKTMQSSALTLRGVMGKQLWSHLDAQAAALAAAEARASELRGQVTSLLEDFANGCVPVRGEAGKATTPYWLAVNSERHRNLEWAKMKCQELGIEWPIKPIPFNGAAAPVAESKPEASSGIFLNGDPATNPFGPR